MPLPSTSSGSRTRNLTSTRTSARKTLPPLLVPIFNDNAVSDTGDLQGIENEGNNDPNIVIEVMEDDNMSQCTQDEDLLSDLERQGIDPENIKQDVERVALAYRNDSVCALINKLSDKLAKLFIRIYNLIYSNSCF